MDTYGQLIEPKLARISILSQQGMSEEEIAHKLKISPATFSKLRKTHVELDKALRSKEIADEKVLNAFFRKACGGVSKEEVKELKETKEADGSIRRELVVTKQIKKDVPPDMSAIKWWLENIDSQAQALPTGLSVEEARALLEKRRKLLEEE